MTDIAIYGAGGYGREIACLINRINREVEPTWNLIGFFDDGLTPGTENEYGMVLGNIDTLNSWPTHLCVAFAIGSPKTVAVINSKITKPDVEFPNIIAPDTLFLDRNNVRIGRGNVICARCLVSCNVEIGDFNTFNDYVTIGHDAIIGNYNSIMPAVKISGGVRIGNQNFIGVNSVILQYKKIGNNTTVGASAVILRNTKEGCTYVGNPAKKIEY